MPSVVNVTRFVRGGKIGDNAQSVKVISNVLDFGQLAVASGDVVGALKIDPGTVVLDVGVKVITAEGGAGTVTVGDQTAVDTYLQATDVNSEATDVGDSLAAPIYYKADDYITVVAGAAIDKAKLLVWAVVANIFGNR
jgi:hypothetical protein